jgi:hypothetical protein
MTLRHYAVYRATFKTKKKTKRVYVGSSCSTTDREQSLQKPGKYQPLWLRAGCADLDIKEMVFDLGSKPVAEAIEAMVAGREIEAHPKITRGGPWLLKELSKLDRSEMKAVSGCSSLQNLFEIAKQFPGGHLDEHLRNVKFTSLSMKTAVASSGSSAMKTKLAPTTRPKAMKAASSGKQAMSSSTSSSSSSLSPASSTASLPKEMFARCKRQFGRLVRRRSGTCGNQWRINNGLASGKAGFKEAKWGLKPDANHAKHDKKWRCKARKKPAAHQ